MYLGENKILSVNGGVVQHENGTTTELAPRVVELLQTEESFDNGELQHKIRTLIVGEIQQIFLDYSLPFTEIEAITQVLSGSISHNRGTAIAQLFGKKYYTDITFRDIHNALMASAAPESKS